MMEPAVDPKKQQSSNAELEKTQQITAALKRMFGDVNKEVSDFADTVRDLSDDVRKMASNIKEAALDKAFDSTKAVELLSKLKDIQKQIEETASSEKSRDDQVTKLVAKYKELRKELDKINYESEIAGAELKDLFPKLGRNADAVYDMGINIGKFGSILSKSGGFMKGLGGAAIKAGASITGISKLLVGWPALIALGVKAVWDFGMKVDQFVKDQNRAFARVRGPDIMTKDVKKQFKEFNNALFSTVENIRVGLRANEVREFTEAVVQSGLQLNRLNTGFTNYREAVYIAAKASKTLGLELPTVGNMMGDLITNFRMDLKQVDKSFVQVAFDAQRSGLSTDKFWSAVQNASASLAFYGVFVEQASKMLAKFNETGVQGAEENAKTTEELTKSFVNMDKTQRAAFMGLVQSYSGKKGVEVFKKAFTEIAEQWKAKAEGFQTEIDIIMGELETPEGKSADEIGKLQDRLKQLQNEQAAAQAKQLMAQEAIGKNAVEMAHYLPLIAERAPELISDLVDQFGGFSNLQGQSLWVMEEIFKTLGLSSNLMLSMKQMAMQRNSLIDKQLGLSQETEGTTSDLLNRTEEQLQKGKENSQKINAAFDNLASNIGGNRDAVNESTAQLSKILMESLGMNEADAKRLAEISALDKKVNKRIAALLTSGKKISKEERAELSKLVKGQRLGDKEMASSNWLQAEAQKELAKSSDETFKKIRDQTLSYQDMTDIAKDELKWRGASLGILQSLNTGVFNIFKHILKGEKTPEEKETQAQLQKATGIDVSRIPKMYGYMQRAERSEIANKLVKKLDESTRNLELLSNMQATLEKIKSGEPVSPEEMKNLTSKMTKEQKQLFIRARQGDKEALKKLEDLKSEAEEQLKKDTRNIELLKTADQKFVKMVKALQIIAMGTDQSREELGKELSEMILNGKTLADIQEEYGLNEKQALDLLYESSEKGDKSVKDAFEKARRQAIETYTPPAAPVAEKKPDASMQGLTKPVQVVAPEMLVKLHKGEMIFPEPREAGAGVGAGGRTIQINVTATERDLAQRIANEIRSVMYREQLTGAA